VPVILAVGPITVAAVATDAVLSPFPCYALIDSGADDCIFPASFGRQLGLDIQTGRHYPFGGAGSVNLDAYFFDIQIAIPGIRRSYNLAVGFTEALEPQGCGLLGQNGFFDRFSVRFNHSRGIITINT
jgi:hypothetical protein